MAEKPKQTPGHSVIDLTPTTLELGYLRAWTFYPDYVTPSDHELISFDLENMNNTKGPLEVSTATTGWDLKGMTGDQKKKAHKVWTEISNYRRCLNNISSKVELDNEAE